jgi:unconventional prefoldin RPB5 interactor 1
MPGKIIHTNEVLVLLGDNWFVERSAKQASEIIERRLAGIETHLDKLQKELKMFIEQKNWTSNVMSENEKYVNIQHEIDEIPELKPRSTKELSEKEKLEQRAKLQDKAKLFQARVNESIKKIKTFSVSSEEEEDEEDREEEEEEDIESLSQSQSQALGSEEKLIKTVKWSDETKFDQDDESYDSDDYTSSEESDEKREQSTNVIKITHTNLPEENPLLKQRSNQLINTPSDVYRLFHKPKSILKTQISTEENKIQITEEPASQIETNSKEQMPKFEPLKAFSGEIVEKEKINEELKETKTLNNEPVKKVSKFKQSRLIP